MLDDGTASCAKGDVVPFPRGPEGGHQIRNDGETIVRLLIVSAHADPDVAEYRETGKTATIVHGEHTSYRAADAAEHAVSE